MLWSKCQQKIHQGIGTQVAGGVGRWLGFLLLMEGAASCGFAAYIGALSEALMEETCQGLQISSSCLELGCFCSWLISSVRGEVFNSRFFQLFLLFRIIYNFLDSRSLQKQSVRIRVHLYRVVSMAVIFFDSYISWEENNGIRYEKLLCSPEFLENVFEAVL